MSDYLSKSGIIIVHILAWAGVIAFCNIPDWYWGYMYSDDGTLLWPSIYGNVFNAIIFYGNAHLLYPNRKKKHFYILKIIGLILITSVIEAVIDHYFVLATPDAYARRMADLEELNISIDSSFGFWSNLLDFSFQNTFFHVAYFLLSFAYILPIEATKNKRKYEQLEHERMTAELQYLKAQINPHFLFNGINSVYHLIGQDDTLAKNSLLRFSDLLRYQLYECNADFTDLEKEISYLEDYVAMEKIRKGDDVDIQFVVENELENAKIAPLLLMPFVENAFKYLSDFDEKANEVHITLHAKAAQIEFTIENTYEREIVEQRSNKSKGIGLENVRKRLALIYPEQHDLQTAQTEEHFQVSLTINTINTK